MFNFGIYSIDRVPLTAMLAIQFRCGCAMAVAPCEYPHEEGPCGVWGIAPHALVCVNHRLILSDQRSLN